MKKTVCILLMFSVLFVFVNGAKATLSVTQTGDPMVLVSEILGMGITSMNETFVGAAGPLPDTLFAAGTFTNGLSSGIGIDAGIILTSGDVSLAPGPNVSDEATGDNQLPGDPDLDALIPETTNDATILEFDFVSNSESFSFRYAFASEEYNEYVFSEFNDVFAFIFEGQNLALIPGTTTPVSVNNVNDGNPFPGPPNSYPQFYNNNDLDDGGPFFDIEYDGFTDVFTAGATGLTPGDTYHIKLAIADASDWVLDSAVFIEAGSFTDQPPPPIPEPATMLLLGSGLVGLAGFRKRFKKR
jgi:hypothetical protein